MFPALLLTLARVDAHGIDAHRVQVELVGDTVRISATPGVDAFPGVDTDQNGVLDRAEVAARRADMRASFEQSFKVVDESGAAPRCPPASVSTVGEGAAHVRVTLQCDLAPARERAAPRGVTLRLGALGATVFTVDAMRAGGFDGAPAAYGAATLAPRGTLHLWTRPVGHEPVVNHDPTAPPDSSSRAGTIAVLAAGLSALVTLSVAAIRTRRRTPGAP